MTVLQKLEERSAQLQKDLEALTVNGELGSENVEKFNRIEAELHGVEGAIRDAKDAELDELRSAIAAMKKQGKGGAGPDGAEVAFRDFLKGGVERVEKRESLIAGTDANGGFLVPENLHAKLVEPVRAVNPIMRMATTFNMTGSNSIELPVKATNGAVANATETGERTEQNAPTIGNSTLTAHDYYSDQRASQLYLDEVAGAESMLMNWIYEHIYEQAEKDAVAGDGADKIKGLFTEPYKSAKVKTAGTVTAADIMAMYFKLAPAYRANSTFLVNSDTLCQLMQLTHPAAAGTIPFVTMVGDKPYILGRPVEECENAPAIGTKTTPIAFGDIAKAYAVGIHKNTSILRDPYTATPKIRFYACGRIGGKAWDTNAAVLLSTEASA